MSEHRITLNITVRAPLERAEVIRWLIGRVYNIHNDIDIVTVEAQP